jgi:protein-disulfide isomerase
MDPHGHGYAQDTMTDLRSSPPPPLGGDDHVRGDPAGALIVFYADFTCPRCALAHERLGRAGARVAFRHLALRAKHERALPLACAAEAAAAQGAFWEFCDALYADQGRLDDPHLWDRARALGLDLERFDSDRRGPAARARVRRDVRAALAAGATTTPTLFFGATAHSGVPDEGLLTRLGYDAGVRIPKASKDAGAPTDGRARIKDNFI